MTRPAGIAPRTGAAGRGPDYPHRLSAKAVKRIVDSVQDPHGELRELREYQANAERRRPRDTKGDADE